MQCASSTASNLTPAARTASRNRPLRNRSGDNVDQPELAGRHAFQPGVLLRRRQRAVDEAHRQAQRLELIDLILHQGDQRRDDQGQTVQGDGGQLVAEALTPAGGHDTQAVLLGQNR